MVWWLYMPASRPREAASRPARVRHACKPRLSLYHSYFLRKQVCTQHGTAQHLCHSSNPRTASVITMDHTFP